MALRLDEQVVRGEIDNRVRGEVTGRVWFVDRPEPVELALAGNAWRDLAGRRLTFVNPAPRRGDASMLAGRQKGVIGDCTASRKVRVPEVPMDELMRLADAGQPYPWHWGNSLYLEWHSERNGRVVIESATYELTITDEPAWEMSAEEELAQRRANESAMEQFLDRTREALAAAIENPPAEKPFEPDRPMSEAEAEAMQAQSDLLADRIRARLEREGPDADIGRIVQEELERRSRQRGDEPLTPEQRAQRDAWLEDLNEAADDLLANSDVLDDDSERHPLIEEASELAMRIDRELNERGAIPDDASREHPLVELITAMMSVAPKLAGALEGESWPPELDTCALVLVRIKRAHGYLEDALLAADDCAEQALVDPIWLSGIRAEIVALAQICAQMIDELRTRLENNPS